MLKGVGSGCWPAGAYPACRYGWDCSAAPCSRGASNGTLQAPRKRRQWSVLARLYVRKALDVSGGGSCSLLQLRGGLTVFSDEEVDVEWQLVEKPLEKLDQVQLETTKETSTRAATWNCVLCLCPRPLPFVTLPTVHDVNKIG